MNNKNVELIQVMHQISEKMHDVIFLEYYDKKTDKEKYIYSIANDAYTTIESICPLMQKAAINQCGILIRMLVEQVSIFTILVNHPELLDDYIEHYKFKIEILDLELKEQRDKISEHYDFNRNFIDPLAYLDYGWIGKKNINFFKENEMIKFAGLKDIIIWKQKYLDKMGHSTFSNVSYIKDGEFPIINNMIEIMCKLFDHLCCNFHNYCGFNFDFNDKNLFTKEFIPLYRKYYL